MYPFLPLSQTEGGDYYHTNMSALSNICKLSIVAICAMLFASCESPSGQTDNIVSFAEVQRVCSFPVTISASNKVPLLKEPSIGMVAFCISGDYLIAQLRGVEYNVEVYSYPQMVYKGRFINRGNGPREFLNANFAEGNCVYERDGESYVLFDVMDKDYMFELNVTESVKEGITEGNVIHSDCRIGDLRRARLQDDTFLFCNLIYGDGMRLERRIFRNGDSYKTPPLEKLNEGVVHSADMMLLDSSIGYNEKADRIVEASSMRDVVNVYSPDGSFCHSLSVNKSSLSLSRLAQTPREDLRRYYYGLCSYPNCFALLYIGKTQNEMNIILPSVSIQIFDWDGNALAEIKVPSFINSFYLDFYRNKLIGFEYETGDVVSFDVDLSSIPSL